MTASSAQQAPHPGAVRWWLIVGWDRSNAPVKSHTHASPPAWDATSDISRKRTGSASAFSRDATWSAWSSVNGSTINGEQQATVCNGVTGSCRRAFDDPEFDIRLC